MVTPRDVFEQLQRALAAAQRVEAWNEQMRAAADVVRAAAANGRGAVVSLSHARNVITAVESDRCPVGQVLVVDADKLNTVPRLNYIAANVVDPARSYHPHPRDYTGHPRVSTSIITTTGPNA